MRTRAFFITAIAVVAAACSGSPTVATVNGEPITAEDVHAIRAETVEDPVTDGERFRTDLDLLVVNAALRTAAEEQFGVTGLSDPDRLAATINDPAHRRASLFASVAADPDLTYEWAEGAAQFFMITDAVLAEIAPGASIDEPDGMAPFTEWYVAALQAAEIEVKSQVGIWDEESLSVQPPP